MKISKELKESIEKDAEFDLRETVQNLLTSIERLERLEEIIAEEMLKSDEESDLCVIGEKVVGFLGYWG